MLAAQRAYEVEDWETCISRAYYAAYHAVVRLLEVRAGLRRRRWDHDQLRADFHTNFANRGFLFSRRDADDFTRLQEDRLAVDYESDRLDRRAARRGLDSAHRLCGKVSEVIRDV